VSREDVTFLTWDHPMVAGAVDLLLGSEVGNCAFALLPAPERTLLLELLYVLEPTAVARLHVDRFLPATPIRLVVNHQGENVTAAHSGAAFDGKLTKGSPTKLLQSAQVLRKTLPTMIKQGLALAEAEAALLRKAALEEMTQLMQRETVRLKELMRMNGHVRVQELELAQKAEAELLRVISEARPRLDAVRLIWKGLPL
jgi:ATP-dependent helicase HepA